jgi:signal peptidase I
MATHKSWRQSEWFSIVVIVVLMIIGRSSLADHYYVPSGSMENSLLPGDRVVVDKTAYGVRLPLTKVDLFGESTPRRGDIAVFDSPLDGTLLIKRIVAVGGDLVRLRDGRLSINGRELAASFGRGSDAPLSGQQRAVVELFERRRAWLNLEAGGGPDINDLRVPTDMVLALGDHRGNSRDGRYFGLIHEKDLLGRAMRVYFRRGEGFVWREL